MYSHIFRTSFRSLALTSATRTGALPEHRQCVEPESRTGEEEGGATSRGQSCKGRGGGASQAAEHRSLPASPTRPPMSLSSPVSPTHADAGSNATSNRRNTLTVGKALKQQPAHQQVSPLLRADTTGLQGVIDTMSRQPSAASAAPPSDLAPGGM